MNDVASSLSNAAVSQFVVLNDQHLDTTYLGGIVGVQLSRTMLGVSTIRIDLAGAPVGLRTLSVPLRPVGGRCDAVFDVTPTKIPGAEDMRRLGVRFISVVYTRA